MEAVIIDPTLADFAVAGNTGNLQDRDSTVLAILDDDGELFRSICL